MGSAATVTCFSCSPLLILKTAATRQQHSRVLGTDHVVPERFCVCRRREEKLSRAANPTPGAGQSSSSGGAERRGWHGAGGTRGGLRGEVGTEDPRRALLSPTPPWGQARACGSWHPTTDSRQISLIWVVVTKSLGFSWEPPVIQANDLTRCVFEHHRWMLWVFPAQVEWSTRAWKAPSQGTNCQGALWREVWKKQESEETSAPLTGPEPLKEHLEPLT